MVTEKDYLEALDRAIKTKKQYLAAELENEGRSMLASVEDDTPFTPSEHSDDEILKLFEKSGH